MVWIKFDDVLQQKLEFPLHHLSVIDQYWPLQRGCFGSWDVFLWPLWKGCQCREIKVGVNVWTVHRPKTSGHCREVAVIGGSTVYYSSHWRWVTVDIY